MICSYARKLLVGSCWLLPVPARDMGPAGEVGFSSSVLLRHRARTVLVSPSGRVLALSCFSAWRRGGAPLEPRAENANAPTASRQSPPTQSHGEVPLSSGRV